MRHGWLWIAVVLLTASTLLAAGQQQVYVARVQGAIGPATASYLQRAITEASNQQAQCLIIELDTPGGLLQSTKQIIQAMLASPVPIVIYVSPSGATATSAGCFITMASDIAAMAPATSIGAAHPVELGGAGGSAPDPEMKKKLENYAASYIESVAARHGRNAQWAVSAVRESVSITAEQAKEQHVVEILASDMPDLLRQLDGRTVRDRPLLTAQAQITPVAMTASERMFQAIWGPEIMFILMLVAIYGLIGELSNPGAILPGVAGGIALILMLYMASILPVNIAAIALVILALALFAIDAFAPTHGVLTVGGALAFLLGGLMMFDRTDPQLRIPLWLLIPSTALTLGFFLFIVGAGLRAQFLSTKTGREAMLGQIALAISPIGPEGGRVLVEGEYWNAISDHRIPAGSRVRICSLQGLQLTVTGPTALEEQGQR